MRVVARFDDPRVGRSARAWVRSRTLAALDPWAEACGSVQIRVRGLPGIDGAPCLACTVRVELPDGAVEAGARHPELETAVTRALARAALAVARRLGRERRRTGRARRPRFPRVTLR